MTLDNLCDECKKEIIQLKKHVLYSRRKHPGDDFRTLKVCVENGIPISKSFFRVIEGIYGPNIWQTVGGKPKVKKGCCD